MNYLLIPTVLLSFILFMVGLRTGHHAKGIANPLLVMTRVLLAIPGIIMASYYLKIFREPIWLYQFRSMPLTELTAAARDSWPAFFMQKYPSIKKLAVSQAEISFREF